MALRQEMSGNNSTLHIQEQFTEESKQDPVNQPVGEIPFNDIKVTWYKLDGGASSTISLGKYNDELLVIKQYKINDKEPELPQKAMLKEWEILSASFGPYVVRPVAYCQKPPLILMEYMKNGALDCYMATHKIHNKQKVIIANDIALSILRLLEIGVVHRDIKSGNVLLTQDLHAKMCDFDLSTRLDSKERIVARGTPEYVAPEYYYFLNVQNVSLEAADVFSFGVLLAEMFVSRDVFIKYAENFFNKSRNIYHLNQVNKVAILKDVLNEHAKNLPKEIESIIFDCLNLRPKNRPSMSEIQQRLSQLLLMDNVLEEQVIKKQVKKNSSLGMISIFASACRTASKTEKTAKTEKTNICSCAIL